MNWIWRDLFPIGASNDSIGWIAACPVHPQPQEDSVLFPSFMMPLLFKMDFLGDREKKSSQNTELFPPSGWQQALDEHSEQDRPCPFHGLILLIYILILLLDKVLSPDDTSRCEAGQKTGQCLNGFRINPALDVSSVSLHVDQSSLPKFLEVMGNRGRIDVDPFLEFTDASPYFLITAAFNP
jgi:hypothetical protein